MRPPLHRVGPHSTLLYSSHAPSSSLHHAIPPNAYEPFHSMNETIRARLHEVVLAQEAEDAHVAAEPVNGAVDEQRETRIDEMSKGGPAIVPALLKSLCRACALPRGTLPHLGSEH